MTLALYQPTTREAFLQVFNRLAVALREKDADAAMLQVYFDSLFDLPMAAIERSAVELSKQLGRKWFPTTAEWREVAEKASRDVLRAALPAPARADWRNDCTACEDTGWEYFSCLGGSDPICGLTSNHYAHEFVRICQCRPTNRTWQRHHHFGQGTA